MRIIYHLLLIFVTLFLLSCKNDQTSQVIDISPNENFPRWLKSGSYQTMQSSGITYLGLNKDNQKSFLIADDIGKIHRLTIESDTIFTLDSVSFSSQANEVFSRFPKPDFEEIFYDKHSGEVFLSIEGNGENYLDFNVILKIIFRNEDIFENEITDFEEIVFEPKEEFQKYLQPNIGYEGMTADSRYFYLGLEGRVSDNIFADSTFIFIAEKSSREISRIISTKKIGIHTICGLFSDDDFSLWGIDRNNRKVFHLLFDEDFNISKTQSWEVQPSVPGYKNYSYTASLESITIADESIYLVDDPWYQFFKPSEEIISKLDDETVQNFDNFVPVIYKFILSK